MYVVTSKLVSVSVMTGLFQVFMRTSVSNFEADDSAE